MEELNKKIAEWVGFRFSHYGDRKNFFTGELMGMMPFWIFPNGDCSHLPNFTESLDACFKYIVPKLNRDGWFVNIFQSMPVNYWKCQLSSPYSGTAPEITLESLQTRPVDCAETPALAFCKAVEKLIDESVVLS